MNKIKAIEKKRNFIKDAFVAVFVVIFMFYIISYPEKSVDFVIKALNLCYIIIIPSIFPFLIISKLFFNSPLFNIISKLLNKPAKFIFNIQGEYTNAFLLGSIAGFPLGAKSAGDIYAANKHTKSEAERTLAFCNNCSAPFIIAAAGVAVFGSAGIGLVLFFTQVISALFTGIIIRFLFKDKIVAADFAHTRKYKQDKKNTADLPSVISEAVTGILNICGIIIFFYMVINIFLEMLGAVFFVAHNQAVYNAVKIAVSGFLEISSGIYSLVNLDLPLSQKLIIASAILSWSGVSVHFQIIYVLKNTGLSLKPYFTGKIIHVIISSVIIKILFSFNSISVMCQTAYAPMLTLDSYDVYMASLVVTGIVSGITVFVIVFAALCFYFYEKRSPGRKKFRYAEIKDNE